MGPNGTGLLYLSKEMQNIILPMQLEESYFHAGCPHSLQAMSRPADFTKKINLAARPAVLQR